eukprot:1160562-Pelagomonas_calceolata.AAC.2
MVFWGLVSGTMLLLPDTLNIKEALCNLTSAMADATLDPAQQEALLIGWKSTFCTDMLGNTAGI